MGSHGFTYSSSRTERPGSQHHLDRRLTSLMEDEVESSSSRISRNGGIADTRRPSRTPLPEQSSQFTSRSFSPGIHGAPYAFPPPMGNDFFNEAGPADDYFTLNIEHSYGVQPHSQQMLRTTSMPRLNDSTASAQMQKKASHIAAEQRRRETINAGYERLKTMVPSCRDGADSKAAVLEKTASYIDELSSMYYDQVEENHRLRANFVPPDPRLHYPAHGPAPRQYGGHPSLDRRTSCSSLPHGSDYSPSRPPGVPLASTSRLPPIHSLDLDMSSTSPPQHPWSRRRSTISPLAHEQPLSLPPISSLAPTPDRPPRKLSIAEFLSPADRAREEESRRGR